MPRAGSATQAALVVDVGNTQTVLGVLEGTTVLDLFRLTSGVPRTGDELFPTLERLVAPRLDALRGSGRAVVGSVVPALTSGWESALERLLGRRPYLASPVGPHGLRVMLRDPASVGVDRIANAVAAAALHRLPAIVVDLGTATTFDVVVPGPRYLGGAIAPGVLTSADELFRRAARLARVELRRPPRAVGRTTEECIQSGVYFGAVAQIDGLVRRLRREIGGRVLVLATGGLAEGISADARTIDRVEPALTLQGLSLMEQRARASRRRRGSPLPGRERPA